MTKPPWTDLTIRPNSEPEVSVTLNGEFEYSFELEGGETPGRLTVLVPREVADKVSAKTRDMLRIVPAVVLP